jgi:phosphatidylglycerophosphate synthase
VVGRDGHARTRAQRSRPPVDRPAASRAFVDQALGELRRSRWRPGAWAAFLWRCAVRSREQALAHPRAAIEVTVLHLLLLAFLPRSILRVSMSWGLAVTHLGLLGQRSSSIGAATVLSLVRGNLPAGRLAPIVAVASDLADGWLARLRGPTAFGAYTDSLADVAFWTRQAWTWESNRALRWAAAGVWLVPPLGVAGAYFLRGRTIDYPRPLAVREAAAAFQCLLAARALTSGPEK